MMRACESNRSHDDTKCEMVSMRTIDRGSFVCAYMSVNSYLLFHFFFILLNLRVKWKNKNLMCKLPRDMISTNRLRMCVSIPKDGFFFFKLTAVYFVNLGRSHGKSLNDSIHHICCAQWQNWLLIYYLFLHFCLEFIFASLFVLLI